MNVIMPSEQCEVLKREMKDKKSANWDGTSSWNEAFFRGVVAANGRIHDLLDAIRGSKSNIHTSGLAKDELIELAEKIGIEKSKIEKTKKAIWAQISRRMSSDISKDELYAIFKALATSLADNELLWLETNSKAIWKDADPKSEDWVARNTATITDLEFLIEDIISMAVKTKIQWHHAKLTRADLFAIEKRIGVTPPTSQIFSKGFMKARILKKIQDSSSLR